MSPSQVDSRLSRSEFPARIHCSIRIMTLRSLARRAAVVTAPLAVASVLVVGCKTTPPPQEVAADVAAYVDRMRSWAPVEGETGRSIERILGTQFVEESTVLHELDDGIPRADAHLRRIEAFTPRTPAVQAVHQRYLHAWNTLREGFQSIRDGLLESDGRALATGREALIDWRRGLRAVAADLRRLRTEYPTSAS